MLAKFAYPPVPTYVLPSGINDNGIVILSSPQSSVGFVGQPGAFVLVSFPGATQTSLNGINNAGVVVGSYLDASGIHHGFLYKPDGTYTTFDGPIFSYYGTELTGINNRGDIIGVSNQQPFIYINGSFDLLFGDRPTSINDNDQILFPTGYHGSNILDYRTNTLEVILNPDGGNPGGHSGISGQDQQLRRYRRRKYGYLLLPIPEPATFLLTLLALAGLAFLAKRHASK